MSIKPLAKHPFFDYGYGSERISPIRYCTTALGNIAGDSLESAEHLVVQGAASGFAMMVAATGASRAVAFAVSNLARLSSAVEPLLVGGVLLPALVQLYRTGDISEAAEAGWALAHVSYMYQRIV